MATMDHSNVFWIGLCYLRMNQLDSASKYIQKSINRTIKPNVDNSHYVEWFYLGIAKYEQKDYLKSLEYLTKSISQNEDFPDALYYKALILSKLNKKQEAKILLEQAKTDLQNGYGMNEDNEPYVNYPYQIKIGEIEELLKKR